ncbi:MAG: potassium transporter TrkH [Pseudozobellia sp.]|nr:potassium transporter TrkH [Pseudozobellia sp.]MBG49079.1 potassium transporter TrkH [Pseudozobellia sp.]|tara:strand:- start:1598550 stop:1599902 length:1353 start_codon:yes stop_codon:yes gene_type:complete
MSLLKVISGRYLRFKLGLSPQQNLFYGFLSYVVFGTLFLCIPWLQKVPVSFLDNLFVATSAVSTTGLATVSVIDSYNFFGQLVILGLIQLGGIGYLTFTTFMILSTSRKMTRWHQNILKTEFTLPKTIQISDFLKSVIFFTLIMEAIGTVLYYISFNPLGLGFWQTFWNALFHSISAFCTAGFSLFESGFTTYTDHLLVNSTTSFLAIAGSLGFIVVTDFVLFLKEKNHQLSFTTKIILMGSLTLLTMGFLFFYIYEPTISELNGSERIWAAFFQSMSAMTTVGFNTVDYGAFVLPMLLVTIFLMYVGASPSGTAGGMKITTLTAVIAIMKSRLRNHTRITFFGRAIPYERLYVATSSFIFYTSIIALGTFALSFIENFRFEDLLFEVASALGTVGLSTGITGDLGSLGKLIIIVLMFIGRLGVLTFGLALWAKQQQTDEKKALRDDIAV